MKIANTGGFCELRSVLVRAMIVSISMLICDFVFASASDEKPVEQPVSQNAMERKNFAQLIDALENRNSPPVIEYFGGFGGAFFSEGYDWKEQNRVVDAIKELINRATPEVWDQLWRHVRDERYSFTFDDEWETSGESAKNWSVGRLCSEIALFQLYYPVREATSVLNLNRDGRVVFLPLGGRADVPRTDRRPLEQMSFVDRQIGLCHDAIADLPKINSLEGVDKVSAETIDKARNNLELMINKLKESKTGLFGQFSFPGKRFRLYDVHRAENDRAKKEAARARAREAEREFYRRRERRDEPNTSDDTIRKDAEGIRNWRKMKKSLDKNIEDMKNGN